MQFVIIHFTAHPHTNPWIDYAKFYPGLLKKWLGLLKNFFGNRRETLWSKYYEPIVMNENIIHALKHIIIFNTYWSLDITNLKNSNTVYKTIDEHLRNTCSIATFAN